METLKMYYCIIPSDLSCICNTVKQVQDYLSETVGLLSDSDVFEIKVILNELLINAIKHGNRENLQKNIKIHAGITKCSELFVIVEDEGEGFDYNLPSTCEKNPMGDCSDYLNETGRGIFIVKNLCDKVKFNIRGNKVVVLKKLLGKCINS